jgi:hypothetical protein
VGPNIAAIAFLFLLAPDSPDLPRGGQSFFPLRAFRFGFFSGPAFAGTLPRFGTRLSVSASSETPDGCLINQTSCFLVVMTVFFLTDSAPIHFS